MIEKTVKRLEDRQVFLWSLSTVAVFIIALLPRLTAIGVLGQDPKHEQGPVWEEWGVIVERVAKGDGYSYYSVSENNKIISSADEGDPIPSAYMPPGYVLFLLPFVYTFGKGMLIVQILQSILGSISCVFVYKVAKHHTKSHIAFISSMLLSFYPSHIYLSTQISSGNVYIPILLVGIYLVYQFTENKKRTYLIGSAILFGFLSLSRAQMILLVPVVAIWIIYEMGWAKRYMSIAFVATSVMVLSPWMVRNYMVFDKVIPVAQSSGYALWRGHNLGTRGAWNDSASVELKNSLDQIKRTKTWEASKDSVYLKYALDTIYENPVRSLKLAGLKFMYMWGYFWGVGVGYPGVKSPLYYLPWFTIELFFIIGLLHSFKNWNDYVLIYAIIYVFTLVGMTFLVLPRYRLTIVPLITIFSSIGLFELIEYARTIPQRERIFRR